MCEAGHDAFVLSGWPEAGNEEWRYGTVSIHKVAKPRTAEERVGFLRRIRAENIDALYWPFAWWGAGNARWLLGQLDMRIVGYIPGARYMFRSVLRAIPSIGLHFSLPYLAQSLYPDSLLTREMKRVGVDSVITMTDFSRQALIRGGWPEDCVIAVPPGKSPVDTPATDAPVFRRIMRVVGDKPFFLFFGPPTAIRGINQLLNAFSRVAAEHDNARLVCLFRSDSNVDMAAVRRKIEEERQGDRIQCVWQSLTPAELAAFLNACHAVVLPFLLIPSEIPLAIIEASGHGKPVISTGPGGTGEFVAGFGLSAQVGDVADLADKMDALLVDRDLYENRCRRAHEVFALCKRWPEVAQSWLAALENRR
jgi:glycosyltransferase involved in cell wall biosynthesis